MAVKYLTPEDIAERLGVSVQWVYRRRSSGLSMPPAKKIGKYIRFREDDFEAWVDSQLDEIAS